MGLILTVSSQAQSLNSFLDEADGFFKDYVQESQVNYASLSENNQELESLVNQVAHIKSTDLVELERKAFYLNAYNISVLNGIIDNYPTQSPLDTM